MFKQPKPPGQPPTGRNIAESKNVPANFPTDLPYDYAAGAPTSAVRGGTYKDDAQFGVTKPVVLDKSWPR